MAEPLRAAVLTVSTSRAAGEGADTAGPRLARWVEQLGLELAGTEIVTDDAELIAASLRRWSDEERCALVATTGGTGFSPNDVTPEATRAVIAREAPGLGEAMRAASAAHTPNWMLSRAIAGVRGSTLIVNFPGNPKAIDETAGALGEALPHALALLAGRPAGHGPH